MTQQAYETAITSIEDLELRLRRLEYYLSGSDDPRPSLETAVSKGRDHTVTARLSTLEQRAYPTLFHPSHSDLDTIPSNLSSEEILAIVAAHGPLYHQTASQLTSIHDLAIPSSSLSTSLISLQPRISKLQSLQKAQAKEMAALRARSAKAVQRWYELGVLGQGECWAEWEGRMEECEKKVRRAVGDRQRDMEEREKYMT
ncbi:MAG: hypothetical protein LQ337_003101 [Flavoplaca oasis]|nr:MAG: hypothetical protein LQ337_003101 [Flavoplaca oasis]